MFCFCFNSVNRRRRRRSTGHENPPPKLHGGADRENPPPQLHGGADRSRNVPQEIIEKILTLLPQEIIEEELLTLLPVKSLLRFKCVSKSWRTLIESDRFIQSHQQKSRDDRTSARQRVIFINKHGQLVQCSRRALMEESSPHLSPIEDVTNNHIPILGNVSVVGSCNGLLCIFPWEFGSFILFNPATRIFHRVPKLDLQHIYFYGFGWDETSDAYKVFVVEFEGDSNVLIGRVYSSKTNSWRTIVPELPYISISDGRGTFTCGKLHWLTGFYDPQIVSFDLKSEVFGTAIELPFKPGMLTWLSETNGCLAMSANNKYMNSFDTWVMEYGVKESWVKEPCLVPQYGNIITSHFRPHSYYESLVSPIPDKHRQRPRKVYSLSVPDKQGQTEEGMLRGGRASYCTVFPHLLIN